MAATFDGCGTPAQEGGGDSVELGHVSPAEHDAAVGPPPETVVQHAPVRLLGAASPTEQGSVIGTRRRPPPEPVAQHALVRLSPRCCSCHTCTHTHARVRKRTHDRIRAHARTRTHARTHTHAHARAHTQTASPDQGGGNGRAAAVVRTSARGGGGAGDAQCRAVSPTSRGHAERARTPVQGGGRAYGRFCTGLSRKGDAREEWHAPVQGRDEGEAAGAQIKQRCR